MAGQQPAGAVQVEQTIKKSRFIGILAPMPDEAAFKAELARLWTLHPHASHICYAYRIQSDSGLVLRFSDDNEPAGTAGKPIFQHLEGNNLINTALFVVRYFGGVKLGAGGLVRAYGGAARAVIEAATLVPYIEYATLEVTLDYQHLGNVEYHLPGFQAAVRDKAFTDRVHLVIDVPAGQAEALRSFLGSLK